MEEKFCKKRSVLRKKDFTHILRQGNNSTMEKVSSSCYTKRVAYKRKDRIFPAQRAKELDNPAFITLGEDARTFAASVTQK